LGQEHSISPRRDATTELHFEYKEKGKTYMVWFSDGFSVGQHIRLAKKYQLGGVSFFKMDGLEDNKMWQIFQEELQEDGL
jgi:spore germination protein YaaH